MRRGRKGVSPLAAPAQHHPRACLADAYAMLWSLDLFYCTFLKLVVKVSVLFINFLLHNSRSHYNIYLFSIVWQDKQGSKIYIFFCQSLCWVFLSCQQCVSRIAHLANLTGLVLGTFESCQGEKERDKKYLCFT